MARSGVGHGPGWVGPRLLGRDSECSVLHRLVSEVVAGASRVLVLRGEAGIGKSALLGYFVDHLTGWRVASATGAESERDLAYSGLHQLCVPLLEHLDQLPGPQRDALCTVLGLRYGPAPDPFLVGLATLTLMAEAADRHPVACVVDDGQWLDHASAQVLAFVARRLLAERVALVCAARTDVEHDVLAGLPELPLHGLHESDARTLLLRNLYGPMDPAIIEQVVRESCGNPLALLELPRTWQSTNLAGGFGLPDSRPVRKKIEHSYVRRLRLLPADAQLLALAAAAEPLGDPALLSRAAVELGMDMTPAAPAVDLGLFEIRDRVKFAHPLARATIYRGASTDDRHRVHSALAKVTDAQLDPDRRAWHRARAAAGPDEDVAEELERSADRAQARGGFAAAAAFLTHAAELTPVVARRSRRALDAAFANLEAGAFDTARRLLAIAGDGPVDEWQRARIELLGGQLALGSGRGGPAAAQLLAAARHLETLDTDLARETYLDAFTAAVFGARLNEGVTVADVAAAARAAPSSPGGSPRTVDVMLDAFTALTDDYESAAPLCRDVLQRLCDENGSSHEAGLRCLWHGSVLALDLWDDESAYCLSGRHAEVARRTGALGQLALALGAHIPVLAFCGDVSAATSAVAEAAFVEEWSAIRTAPYGRVVLEAWSGLEREGKQLVEATLREAGARGEGIGVAVSEYAHAVLCNGLGQYEEALLAASRASEDPEELVAHNWALSELVEAGARAGRTDLAADGQRRLARKARASGTEWALGIETRSRALLSAGDAAEDLYREAIAHLSRTRVQSELARAHLVYGEWLRRSNRRVDARKELTVAYESFSAMDMKAFATRARGELLATGATVRKRSLETTDDLTPQEVQVARLAREGFSNTEIGSHLFISARTVEWHLHKVFRKLGISSRRQLREELWAHDRSVVRA